MNYSDSSAMCRVDFFKDSGKWYCTEAVDFTGFFTDAGIDGAVRRHLRRTDGTVRLEGMTAVCLEPALEHQFPRMWKVAP